MSAKIKLNAASGGGSISINAPSSAGSDTDFLDTSGNLAVSGTTTCTGNVSCANDLSVDNDLKIDSGFGSTTTVYGVRAWIKVNGTGTVAINGSGNISALTDNGTGDYTVTFSTAMPDTNYAAVGIASSNGGNGAIAINTSGNTTLLYSTTQCRFCNSNSNNGSLLDGGAIGAAFIR